MYISTSYELQHDIIVILVFRTLKTLDPCDTPDINTK